MLEACCSSSGVTFAGERCLGELHEHTSADVLASSNLMALRQGLNPPPTLVSPWLVARPTSKARIRIINHKPNEHATARRPGNNTLPTGAVVMYRQAFHRVFNGAPPTSSRDSLLPSHLVHNPLLWSSLRLVTHNDAPLQVYPSKPGVHAPKNFPKTPLPPPQFVFSLTAGGSRTRQGTVRFRPRDDERL